MSSAIPSVFQKAILLTLLMGLLAPLPMGTNETVQAASGMPNSPDFGFGARLDIWGEEVSLAIRAADGAGLEWIGIDFDWARHWPDATTPINLERLDQAMELAQASGLNVLLSLTDTPNWAMGTGGPDPNQTAGLVVMLANRYPVALLTIELFPGANTTRGWGASPNPVAYAALLQSCLASLQASSSSTVLVAGGLSPLPPQAPLGDVDDLAYLSDLYNAGAAAYMPILSIRLNQLSGDAIAPPDQSTRNVLRHYEDIRQMMLRYQHQTGLIWITGFTWPEKDGIGSSEAQIRWLNRAYNLMKSQLYIGVAFFDQLNPADPAGQNSLVGHTLISKDFQGTHLHPALTALGQIISINRTGHASLQLFLYKKLTTGPEKNKMKHRQP